MMSRNINFPRCSDQCKTVHMITINHKNYYTTLEVAEMLKISTRGVMLKVSRGTLKAWKPSPRKTYFELDEIIKYIEK